MLFCKWMHCQVEPHNKNTFAAAQARWSDLAGLPGFLGQMGGWNVHEPTEACIVSFWQDTDTYQHFMQNHHDAIFHKTGQAHSYRKITIEHFQGRFEHTTADCSVLPQVLISACQDSGTLLVSREKLSDQTRSEHSICQIYGYCLNDQQPSIRFQILDKQAKPKRLIHPSTDSVVVALVDGWLVV